MHPLSCFWFRFYSYSRSALCASHTADRPCSCSCPKRHHRRCKAQGRRRKTRITKSVTPRAVSEHRMAVSSYEHGLDWILSSGRPPTLASSDLRLVWESERYGVPGNRRPLSRVPHDTSIQQIGFRYRPLVCESMTVWVDKPCSMVDRRSYNRQEAVPESPSTGQAQHQHAGPYTLAFVPESERWEHVPCAARRGASRGLGYLGYLGSLTPQSIDSVRGCPRVRNVCTHQMGRCGSCPSFVHLPH